MTSAEGRATRCCLLLTGALLLAPQPLSAAHPLLQQAKKRYEAFEFEAAGKILERALEDPKLSKKDRVEALALKGRILLGIECDEAALTAYHVLLRLEPAFELPRSESPKVRECFDRAKATLPAAPETIHEETRKPPEPEPKVAAREPLRQEPAESRVPATKEVSPEQLARTAPATTPTPKPVSELTGGEQVEAVESDSGSATATVVADPGAVSYPPPAVTTPLPMPDADTEASVFTARWFWAGAAVVVAATILGGILIYDAATGPERGNLGHVDGWPR